MINYALFKSGYCQYQWVSADFGIFLNYGETLPFHSQVECSHIYWSSSCPTFAHSQRNWVNHLFICLKQLPISSESVNMQLVVSRSTCWLMHMTSLSAKSISVASEMNPVILGLLQVISYNKGSLLTWKLIQTIW